MLGINRNPRLPIYIIWSDICDHGQSESYDVLGRVTSLIHRGTFINNPSYSRTKVISLSF